MTRADFEWRDAPAPDECRRRELRALLAALQREFAARAQPIIDELVRIERARAPAFLVPVLPGGGIDLDALKAAGLNSREVSEQLLAQHLAIQAPLAPPSGEPGGG